MVKAAPPNRPLGGWIGTIATSHRDKAMMLGAIKYGFSLQYWGNPSKRPRVQPLFTTHHSSHMDREIQPGAMLGPMDASLFTLQHLSPLMTRPKRGGNGSHIIVNVLYLDNENVISKILKNMSYGTYSIHNVLTWTTWLQ